MQENIQDDSSEIHADEPMVPQKINVEDHLGLLGSVASEVAGARSLKRQRSGPRVAQARFTYSRMREEGADISFNDVRQEAMFGLSRAADKFDPSLGNKFSSLAFPWSAARSVQAIGSKDYPGSNFFPIKLPESVLQDVIARRRDLPWEVVANELIYDEYGYYDGQDDADKVSFSDGGDPQVYQYDAEDERATIEADEGMDDLDSSRLLKDLISAAALSDRERIMLALRFGLSGGKPRTLQEVGKEFGVTKERIRQIEARALAELRGAARRKGIKSSEVF